MESQPEPAKPSRTPEQNVVLFVVWFVAALFVFLTWPFWKGLFFMLATVFAFVWSLGGIF